MIKAILPRIRRALGHHWSFAGFALGARFGDYLLLDKLRNGVRRSAFFITIPSVRGEQ
jgi:hypothetical protein